jgi:hypothetical protein
MSCFIFYFGSSVVAYFFEELYGVHFSWFAVANIRSIVFVQHCSSNANRKNTCNPSFGPLPTKFARPWSSIRKLLILLFLVHKEKQAHGIIMFLCVLVPSNSYWINKQIFMKCGMIDVYWRSVCLSVWDKIEHRSQSDTLRIEWYFAKL